MKSTNIALLVNTELDLIASKGTSERVLELVVRAPEFSKHASRPPLNLALIIDRSGSMSGAKLEYAKQAALHVIDLLGPSDQAALVAFDTTVSLLSPSLAISPANRQTLKHLVRMLEFRRNNQPFRRLDDRLQPGRRGGQERQPEPRLAAH